MFIEGDTNKIKWRDLEDQKEKYAIGVYKKQKVMKSEQCPSAPDCTAKKGGGIKIGEFTVDWIEAIRVEIEFLAIKYSKQYSWLSHQEKKDCLRKDKAHRLVDELKSRGGIKSFDVNYIHPLSGEMKRLVETLTNADNNIDH